MTTTVRLARHGQTEPNITGFLAGRSDDDLNEAGYQQARRLSARFAGMPIAAVYTSPLRRTRSTAAILAEPHQLELTDLEELIEIDLGDWEGKYIDEIKRGWPELWRQWILDPSDVTVPNGENLTQITARAVQGLEKIVSAHQNHEVLVITHDIIIKVLVMHALSATNRIYRRFDVSNASLSTIRFENNRPHLITLNDTSHLYD